MLQIESVDSTNGTPALSAARAVTQRSERGGPAALLSLVAGQLDGAERDQACAVFRARLSSGEIEACP